MVVKHGKNIGKNTGVEGCKNEATVGAHVQEKGGGNTTWYILPLCRTHNHCSVVDLDVDGRCLLVSVR